MIFIEHAVRFFSSTQWWLFIEIGRHAVRSGLRHGVENLFSGNHGGSHDQMVKPGGQSLFIFLFAYPLTFKNNQIKKRDFVEI